MAASSLDEWEASFANGLVVASRAAPEPWADGHAYVHDVPEPDDPVRTDAGAFHTVLVFDRPLRYSEERLANGPILWSGPVRAGDLLICPPDFNTSPILARWEGSAAFTSFLLNTSTLTRAAEGLGLDYAATEFRDEALVRDPLLEGVARTLAAEVEAGRAGGRLYAESLFQAAAVHLVVKYTTGEPAMRSVGGLPAGALRRVRAYVAEHLAHDLALAELAAVAGYSEWHFARAFKASTDETPHGYVTRLRVEEGARLLRTAVWGVAAVAAAVGYESPSRFAAAFRRHFGAAPAAYRRQTRG